MIRANFVHGSTNMRSDLGMKDDQVKSNTEMNEWIIGMNSSYGIQPAYVSIRNRNTVVSAQVQNVTSNIKASSSSHMKQNQFYVL